MPKATSKRKVKIKKDDKYECSICGLVVKVDETCGCVGACDIVCCDKPMKKRKMK
jgi:hypothetical protein